MIGITERRRVVITGRVQGIAFLLWIRNVANSLELGGSVRPLADGRCEAVVQGERHLIKQFVVACKRGPAEATIEGIELFVEPLSKRETTFVVYRTPWRQILSNLEHEAHEASPPTGGEADAGEGRAGSG